MNTKKRFVLMIAIVMMISLLATVLVACGDKKGDTNSGTNGSSPSISTDKSKSGDDDNKKQQETNDDNCVNGHTSATAVKENVIEATCEQDGSYDEVVYCSVCKEELSREKIVVTGGHNFVEGKCERCGESQYTQSLIYTLSGDGNSYIVTGIENKDDVRYIGIPSTYNEKPVTSIGEHAFDGCKKLTNVTIPDSVTSIGNYAFAWCRGLTSITIPNNVTSIGNYAFDDCSGLTSITIPDSVINIGFMAFAGCSVTAVHITDLAAWCNISFGNYYANPLCYAEKLYLNGTMVTNLAIPNTVTTIKSYAFNGCSGLTSVTIPNSVTSIGDRAFEGCSGLTSIEIPDSVTSIDEYAFHNCSGLKSVTIGSGVTSIGSYAFEQCFKLVEVWNKSSLTITKGSSSNGYVSYYAFNVYTDDTPSKQITDENGLVIYNGTTIVGYVGTATDITIPNTIKTINRYAFSGCSGLTSITIPDSVTSIGEGAFSGCSGLTSITIPDSVTSIGHYAFDGCSGLTSITIPDSVTSIGSYAFRGCSGLTSITIPDSVTSIGKNAFYNCSGLTSITIPNSVTSIGDSAFRGCSSLTSITIPDSVTSIGSDAFCYCSGLTSVTIGSGVTSIGSYAFEQCYKLVEVWNKSSLTITKGLTDNGYVGYYALNVYTDDTPSKQITDENGLVIYDGTMLVNYVGNATDITIPDTIQTINRYAFSGCSKLTSITFADTTTWYRTDNSINWQNKTGGTSTRVTNPSTNATYFKSMYYSYYWYKL